MAVTYGADLLSGMTEAQVLDFRDKLQSDLLRGQIISSSGGDTAFSVQPRSLEEVKQLIRVCNLRLHEIDEDKYPLRVPIRRTVPRFVGASCSEEES